MKLLKMTVILQNKFTLRGILSAIIGICLALVTFYLIIISPAIILFIGWVFFVFAILILATSIALYIYIQQTINYHLVYRLDGLRYLTWFVGNSLLWIATCILVSAILLRIFGASFWILAICAGGFAVSVYTLQGIFFIRKFIWYRLCWTIPDVVEQVADNPDHAILLSQRYALAIQNNSEEQDYIGHIRLALRTPSAKIVDFDKLARKQIHLYYLPSESWIRIRALFPVFIMTTLISLLFFGIGWGMLQATAEPVRHYLEPLLVAQGAGESSNEIPLDISPTPDVTATPSDNPTPTPPADDSQSEGENQSQQEDSGQGDGESQSEDSGQSEGESQSEGSEQGEGDSQSEGDGQGDSDSQSEGDGQGEGASQSEGSGQGEGDSQSEGTGQGEGESQSEGSGQGEGESQSEGSGQGEGDSQSEGSGQGEGASQSEGSGQGEGDSQSEGRGQGEGESQSESSVQGEGDSQSEGDGQGEGASQSEGSVQGEGDSQSEGTGQGEGESQSEGSGQGEGESQSEGSGQGEGDSQSEGSGQGEGESQSEGSGQGEGDSQSEGSGQGEGDSQSEGSGQGEGESQSEGSGQGEGESQSEGGGQGEGDGQGEGSGQGEGNGQGEGESQSESNGQNGGGGSGDSESGDPTTFGLGESTPMMSDTVQSIPTPIASGINPSDRITVDVPPMRDPSRKPGDPREIDEDEEGTLESAETADNIDSIQEADPLASDEPQIYQRIPNWILELIIKE